MNLNFKVESLVSLLYITQLDLVAWQLLSLAGNRAAAIRTRCALLRFHKVLQLHTYMRLTHTVTSTMTFTLCTCKKQLPDRLHIKLIVFEILFLVTIFISLFHFHLYENVVII